MCVAEHFCIKKCSSACWSTLFDKISKSKITTEKETLAATRSSAQSHKYNVKKALAGKMFWILALNDRFAYWNWRNGTL